MSALMVLANLQAECNAKGRSHGHSRSHTTNFHALVSTGPAEPINTRCFEKESKFFKDGTRRRGKLLPAEAFLLIAENSLAMAARYQPELTNRETGEKQPNPNYNEERYAFFC